MEQEEVAGHAPFVIQWRKGFAVEIEQVDAEHRHLFALVKALKLESAEETVEELLNYVVVHFSNEQALMEQSGYPGFEQHLRLHEDFAAHVADFLGNGDPWTEARVQALRRFLNKWLIGHIMTHDMRFGKWYTAHVHQSAQAETARPGSTPQDGYRGFLSRLLGIR